MGVAESAAWRRAKAHRRKVIATRRRKVRAAETAPAGEATLGASLPIRSCLLTGNLFEIGMGTLVLARGGSFGLVVVGSFLLDSFRRGIRDVMVCTLEEEQLECHIERLYSAMPAVPIDPAYARKLLRDLVEWSESFGFRPPRRFSASERLFGDVDPQACTTEFTFGLNGKPLYISGAIEPLSMAR